jgi:hypothetical protein
MVSCYAKRRLLPDSFSDSLNFLLNVCDCSAGVVGSGRSLLSSIYSLLALLFSSPSFDHPFILFRLLLRSIMGKDKKGQGSPLHSGDKWKREPSPPSEYFGDSEYSEEEFSSESEGSPKSASPPAPRIVRRLLGDSCRGVDVHPVRRARRARGLG